MMVSMSACLFMTAGAILYTARRFFLLRRLGPREYPFRGKFRYEFIGILLASPLLVVGASLRGHDLPVLVTVSVLGVLLFILSYRDILHIGLGGLYANGVVWNAKFVMYRSIGTLVRPDPCSCVLFSRRSRRLLVITGSSEFIDAVSAHMEKKLPPLQ